MNNEKRTYAIYINGKQAASFTSRRSAIDFLDNLKKDKGTSIRWGYYIDNNPNKFIPIEEYTVNRITSRL